MNIRKKLFAMSSLALLHFAFVLCYEGPRAAVGWLGNDGTERLTSGILIYNPLTEKVFLENNDVGNVPLYLRFLSLSSNNLLASLNSSDIYVYNEEVGIVTSQPSNQSNVMACLLVKHGDKDNVVASMRGGGIKAYDSMTGNVVVCFDFTAHEDRELGVCSLGMYQHGDNYFLVAGSTAGFIDIYNYQTGKLVLSINTYKEGGFYQPCWINNLVVFQHGDSIKIIASTSNTPQNMSGQLGCWDAVTGKQEYVVWYCDEVDQKNYASGDIQSLQLYKDVDDTLKLITSARDPQGKIKIWDPLNGTVIQELHDEELVNSATLAVRVFESHDENGKVMKLIAGYWDGKIAVWNIRTGLKEACIYQNKNVNPPISKLVRFISLFDFQEKQYCIVGNDNGDLYTYLLDGLQCVKQGSVGQRNSITALASQQELLIDPKKSQLSYFNLTLGCYVPFVDLNNFVIIST